MNDMKFNPGDLVVVVDAQPSYINCYKYKDGEIGTISEDFDEIMDTWCHVDFVDERGEVCTEALYFWEIKKVADAPTKTTPTFKIGDKVVFCKSSLDSGMIDAKEGDVFTVQVQDDSIVYLKEQSGGYHHTHFEYYVEKEKEMEKKFAKVGDKIRIVAAQSLCGIYKNGDVFEVVKGKDVYKRDGTLRVPPVGGVDILLPSGLTSYIYHTEYEIVEDGKEDDFVFTEEHVGMEVWCTILGKGRIEQFSEADDHPLKVTFEQGNQTYTSEGKMFGFTKCSRSLFFSEPMIEAERFPPKKKFIPALNKGDRVVITTKTGIERDGKVYTVFLEVEDRICISDNGDYFLKRDIASISKLGEEIKFS